MYENPTEAHVTVRVNENPDSREKIVYDGTIPIGETGKRVYAGLIGGEQKSLTLYVILEPNNNYVGLKVYNFCPDDPGKPCDVKIPGIPELFNFDPTTTATPATEEPPQQAFPQKCEPVTLSIYATSISVKGKLCAEIPQNSDHALVQMWIGNYELFDVKVPKGQELVADTHTIDWRMRFLN